MSLINVNNSRDIEVEVVSVQLHSASYGGRYVEANRTHTEIGGDLAYLASGQATVHDLREAQSFINAVLLNTRSLYSIQRMLNDPCWKKLWIDCQVEARVRHTGHGDIKVENYPNIVLLVKTTWQDDQN